MTETRMCPKCNELNPIRNLYCSACGASMTGSTAAQVAPIPASPAPAPAAPAEPIPDGKWQCLRCKSLNPDWRSECEYCKTPRGQRYAAPRIEESSFGGSLGIGCGGLIIANVLTNVLIYVGAALGIFNNTAILVCANVVLLVVIGAAVIGFLARSRQLNWGGVAVSIGIYIVIQIILTPLLASLR
jgi:hypothetical protein